MKEEFLHYIWRFRLIQHPLFTTQQEEIVVLNPGQLNTDSGPDFVQAKIQIGKTIWAGNVEIHILSSDWEKHKHQYDKAYNSTILHVVYACDKHVLMENGEAPPCIELKGKFDESLFDRYIAFLNSKKWIPCSGQLKAVPGITLSALYSRMCIERLEGKTKGILEILERNKNDWEESFYQILAGGFGLKINQAAFQTLAESLPLKKVLRQQNSLFQVEAMLFGQAGLLASPSFKDEYPKALQKEYSYLSKKFLLDPMQAHLWKYLRLRPSNFPCIRIAQFAALLSKNQPLFSKIVEAETVEQIRNIFKISASSYWKTHYLFDKESSPKPKKLSQERIDLLLVNVVIPFLFLYGKQRNKEDMVDLSIAFLEQIEAENNSISKGFKAEGVAFSTAFQTQALTQLKSNYCDQKRCLNCTLGIYLLR